MIKKLNLLSILILPLLIFSFGCNSIYEKKAAARFDEVTTLVKQAQEAEKTSYVQAYEIYKKAFEQLNFIKAEYPSTTIGKYIASGEATVGEFNFKNITAKYADPPNSNLIVNVEDIKKPLIYTEFRDRILPNAKLKAEGEGGDTLACAQFFNSILPPEPVFSIFNGLLQRYLSENDIGKASLIASKISDPNIRSESICYLLYGYQNLPNIKKNKDLLDKLKNLAESIDDPKMRANYCIDLAWEYLKLEDRKSVEELINKSIDLQKDIDKEELKAERCILSAALCNLDKQKDKVPDLLQKVLASDFRKFTRKSNILSNVALEYKKAGYDKEANKSFLEAENEVSLKYGFYSNNAAKWADAGFYDDAFKMASKAVEANDRYKALEEIAKAYSRNGSEKKCLEILESIDDPAYKAKALTNKAYEYIEEGKIKTDTEMLLQAQNILEKSNVQGVDSSKAFAKIAVGYAKAKQFDLALSAAKKIKYPFFIVNALGEIAIECLKAGEKDRIPAIISDLQDVHGITDNSLYCIGKIYTEMGEYDKALEIARKIKSSDAKYSVFSRIVYKYIVLGQYDKVFKIANEFDNYAKRVRLFGESTLSLWIDGYKVNDKFKKLLHDMISEACKPNSKLL
jgi:tetratricopeptide (TPR) repeat protein